MTDDPRPAERVFVTVDDLRWELVPTDKLTFPEAKEVKRVCEMSLAELEEGLKVIDGDAWFAWIYVSIRRKQPKLTVAELEQMIGDTPISAVIESVENETPEVAAPNPPARASLSDADEQTNGGGSGEKTQVLSTLETAGHRT